MIHLERLSKPQKLVEKEKEWLDIFLKSGKERPESKQYAHENIKSTLSSISSNKCFYCESLLSEGDKQVEHHIEVSTRLPNCDGRNLAFDWDNLYLSCKNCNSKVLHSSISVYDVLNPFRNSDVEIENEIYFIENEEIKGKNDIGIKTIQKYKLDTDTLNLLRSRALNGFYKKLLEIKDKVISENRKISKQEKEELRFFANKDRAFSLMFRLLLRKFSL
jgi:hypothetical protein